MNITFNEFTKELMKKKIAISEIKTKKIKENAQLILTCANGINPFVFNWNRNEKRWILSTTD